jgi:hypothetical protein
VRVPALAEERHRGRQALRLWDSAAESLAAAYAGRKLGGGPAVACWTRPRYRHDPGVGGPYHLELPVRRAFGFSLDVRERVVALAKMTETGPSLCVVTVMLVVNLPVA